MIPTQNKSISLKSKWEELKAKSPKLRIRDAAAELEVSELELVTTMCEAGGAINLQFEFKEMMKALETFGYVMGLSRNGSVVHEVKGVYANFSAPSPHVSLFVNPEIDLRIFPSVWQYAVAVKVPSRGRTLKSIQFFSSWGEAIHKIYLTNKSNETAYDDFVERFKHQFQGPYQPNEIVPKNEIRKQISDESALKFQKDWVNLKDTHDFYRMLKQHGLTRLQALELAPKMVKGTAERYALKVPIEALEEIIRGAAKAQVPTMTFVGNHGIIQIFSGVVSNLVPLENWFNVMDKEFNLHLNMDDVSQVWIVFKPTTDGIVSSVEVFDNNEQMLVQLFGKRKPGIPEDENWRSIINRWVS